MARHDNQAYFNILAKNDSVAATTRDNFIELPEDIVTLGHYRVRPKTPKYKIPYKTWSDESYRRQAKQTVTPLPWMTYESIIWMLCNLKAGDTMFEWGGGWSTTFWRERGVDVTTIECGEKWANAIGGNVRLIGKLEPEYITSLDKPYDAVVVDGIRRPECFVHAMQFVKKFMVLDNSNWPEHKFLHDNLAPGWSVHYLGGYARGGTDSFNIGRQMTSIFLPPDSPLTF
jgi:hypothetical protein